MDNKRTIGWYKEQSRTALNNQWGSMAWITFVAFIVVVIIEDVLMKILPFSSGSVGNGVVSFILDNALFFAITYATYYCALRVIRGEKAQVGMLSIVFQKTLYLPMFLLNIIEYFIGFLISLIFLLPVLVIAGSTTYLSFVFDGTSLTHWMGESTNIFVLGLLAVVILFFSVITFFITLFIGGVFQFAVWSTFDHPNQSLKGVLKGALSLMKGRVGQYLLLQLSFFGWYILGVFTLGIGLCWVIPYKNVAIASFYENVRAEKALEETKSI